MSNYFYSCDWGTTKLRVRLVDTLTSGVVAAIETDEGIAGLFPKWKASGEERSIYHRATLQNCIGKLKTRVQPTPGNTPVIISGMVSSNMGMIELPYAELPVKIDGTGLLIESFRSTRDFPYPLILVSGVRTKTDLMRGEETQVIGACQRFSVNEALFILPGTHSKHVWTDSQNIIELKTHMTGELFQLLALHSILSGSLECRDDSDAPGWENFFEEGIMQSLKNDFLESLFGVRVAHLFNKRTPQQNTYYLNGLLIGSELKNIRHNKQPNIIIVSNELQRKYYAAALNLLKVQANITWISSEMATVSGHHVIFQKYFG